jgi:hypothetical protein
VPQASHRIMGINGARPVRTNGGRRHCAPTLHFDRVPIWSQGSDQKGQAPGTTVPKVNSPKWQHEPEPSELPYMGVGEPVTEARNFGRSRVEGKIAVLGLEHPKSSQGFAVVEHWSNSETRTQRRYFHGPLQSSRTILSQSKTVRCQGQLLENGT